MTTMTDATTRVTAGVDTHRDQHVVAALDERGGELGVRSFATTTAGYRQALAWLRSLGPVERIGVEGTGTYGAGLTRYLLAEAVAVVEVNRPNRQLRRRHGKSDPVDAATVSPTPSTPSPPLALRSQGRPRVRRRPAAVPWRRSARCARLAARPGMHARRPSTRCAPCS